MAGPKHQEMHPVPTRFPTERNLCRLGPLMHSAPLSGLLRDFVHSKHSAWPTLDGTNRILVWWARPDSNRGPSGFPNSGYEPAALSVLQPEENLAELRALQESRSHTPNS